MKIYVSADMEGTAGVVAWARRNAEASGLAAAPIRWITEDALKFVKRELTRGNAYDAVILDPPAYGRGPRGESWKLADSFAQLPDACLALTAGRCAFLLITCHSGELAKASGLLPAVLDGRHELRGATAQDLCVTSADGRQLHSGAAVRFSRK